MDEQAAIARPLLPKLFDLGIMGIEIPEQYGGAGGTLFHSVLAVEALSRVDPAIGVLVDVQNTLVVNSIVRWGNADLKQRYLTRLAGGAIGAFCLSEAGSGSDAFALTTRAVDDGDAYALSGRKLWITNANEADVFIVFATVEPRRRLQGHHRLHGRARHGRLLGRQEGRQARHPRQQHLRAALRRLPRAQGQRARRGRQGLQGGDRDPERGPRRHRRADARAGAGRLRPHRRLREGARAVRQGDRRVPGRAVPAGAHGLRRRGARGCSPTTRRGCATPASRSCRRRRSASW